MRLNIQHWDFTGFADLIEAWVNRLERRTKARHVHYCSGCKMWQQCCGPDCIILHPRGRYTLPVGNPDKCRDCR